MDWDNDAADIFTGLLIADSTREGAKIHAETIARRAGHDRVTREDMEKTKKAYYGRVPEEVRIEEFKKRAGASEAELRKRAETAAREMLKRDIELFTVNACRAEPADRNFEPWVLKPEVERKLRELDVTKIITDKLSLKRPINNHHKLIVALAGCANGCITPEARAFGISGVMKPKITDRKCTECYLCVDRCKQNAIILRKGRPEIDFNACDYCGQCIKVCPTQVYEPEQIGFRVFVGGRLGRFHQPGFVLFRITDKETMMRALEAVVTLYRDEAVGEESIADLIKRLGPAPFYQRIYQKN
ncbi:MAG: 4Fe-4S binding protein [Chloroflexota bacterium]